MSACVNWIGRSGSTRKKEHEPSARPLTGLASRDSSESTHLKVIYACDVGSTGGRKAAFAWVRLTLEPTPTESGPEESGNIEGLEPNRWQGSPARITLDGRSGAAAFRVHSGESFRRAACGLSVDYSGRLRYRR